MAGQASIENGKKGGRPKGYVALAAERTRQKIAEMVEKEIVPLTQAQIDKAVKGDTQAYKELMDRGFGKVKEHVDVTTDGDKIVFLPTELYGKRNASSGAINDSE